MFYNAVRNQNAENNGQDDNGISSKTTEIARRVHQQQIKKEEQVDGQEQDKEHNELSFENSINTNINDFSDLKKGNWCWLLPLPATTMNTENNVDEDITTDSQQQQCQQQAIQIGTPRTTRCCVKMEVSDDKNNYNNGNTISTSCTTATAAAAAAVNNSKNIPATTHLNFEQPQKKKLKPNNNGIIKQEKISDDHDHDNNMNHQIVTTQEAVTKVSNRLIQGRKKRRKIIAKTGKAPPTTRRVRIVDGR